MIRDIFFLNFTVATFTYVNTTTTYDLIRCSNELTNKLQLFQINLVYNWCFIQVPKGTDIHKKMTNCVTPTFYARKWIIRPLFKNSKICKHVTHFKIPYPTPLLCEHHKCMMVPVLWQMHKWKMVPLLSNFWNHFTVSYTILIFETTEFFFSRF